jgi:hypothetical protein
MVSFINDHRGTYGVESIGRVLPIALSTDVRMFAATPSTSTQPVAPRGPSSVDIVMS